MVQKLSRRTVMRLAGAAAAASVFSIRRARAADKATVLLDWKVTGQHAPFFVGLGEGIFLKHGIDLTIQPGSGSRNTILAVAANNVTFGSADASALPAAILQGADVKMFCVYMATTPFGIMFTAESGIKVPKDLEGKIYGDFPGSATYALFPAFAKHTKIEVSKVQVVNINPANSGVSAHGRANQCNLYVAERQLHCAVASGRKLGQFFLCRRGPEFIVPRFDGKCPDAG